MSKKRLTVGVLAGWPTYSGTTISYYLHTLFRGIRGAARDYGCNLLIACGAEYYGAISVPYTPPEQTASAHQNFQVGRLFMPATFPDCDVAPIGNWNTDGLIVAFPFQPHFTTYFEDVIAAGHPAVHVGPGIFPHGVVIDNVYGIAQILEHLIQHGHRKIAFVAGRSGEKDSDQRLQAYQHGLAAHGIEYDPQLVVFGWHDHDMGQKAAHELLQRGVQFTALAVSNDISAVGAIKALRSAGLRVPQDVAVTGFDDILEGLVEDPPLTTLHVPLYEMGYRSLVHLIDVIHGRAGDSSEVKVAPSLLIRQSCGCNPHSSKGQLWTSDSLHSAHSARDDVHSQMTRAALGESHQLLSHDISDLCQELLHGYIRSIETGDATPFDNALTGVLDRVLRAGDEPLVWQNVITVLQLHPQVHSELSASAESHMLRDFMLQSARSRISQSVRAHYAGAFFHSATAANQLGLMTAKLLNALDISRISAVLAEHLSSVGVRDLKVIFYEGEDDDPALWSNLIIHSNHFSAELPMRFPTRRFPLPEWFHEGEAYSLVLLPFSLGEQSSGIVVFDCDMLEPCAAITLNLASALRTSSLYRDALEGRRLAEVANQRKQRFLSTISHELRTPLNLIVGLSEVLMREQTRISFPPDTQIQEDIERIYLSAQHLSQLIGDVLDLASSDAGQLRLIRERIDLIETLQPVLAIGEQLCRDRGLEWQVSLPTQPVWVFGDRTRLRQVILNLVSNAVKFTRRGSVCVDIQTENTDALIRVEDTGLGIPLHEQQIIFDEFRSSERTSQRGYGGLGLGLAICRQLMELHGGSIAVRSSGEIDSGSTFLLTLPLFAEAVFARPLPIPEAQTVVLLTADAAHDHRVVRELQQHGIEAHVIRFTEDSTWLDGISELMPEAVLLHTTLSWEAQATIFQALQSNTLRDIPILLYAFSEQQTGALLELRTLAKPMQRQDAQAVIHRYLDGLENSSAILIVDDETNILNMHTRIAQEQFPQRTILQARNGREALETLRQFRVGLVLLDLMMPELDGFGVLEAMRSDPNLRHIPVIILTAQLLSEADMARLSLGVGAILSKGVFSVEETFAQIRDVLELKRRSGTMSQQYVRKAISYIHTHYAEPLTRTHIAAHVGIHENYLTDCFHAEVGLTPIAYLNRFRIRQAGELLQSTMMNVTEIAQSVGFSDSGYFSRVFQRELGVSPSVYRRQHKPL
jgi:AraC-like DNA-binding protein/nitrogen-specific signal transduction histidine kinase